MLTSYVPTDHEFAHLVLPTIFEVGGAEHAVRAGMARLTTERVACTGKLSPEVYSLSTAQLHVKGELQKRKPNGDKRSAKRYTMPRGAVTWLRDLQKNGMADRRSPYRAGSLQKGKALAPHYRSFRDWKWPAKKTDPFFKHTAAHHGEIWRQVPGHTSLEHVVAHTFPSNKLSPPTQIVATDAAPETSDPRRLGARPSCRACAPSLRLHDSRDPAEGHMHADGAERAHTRGGHGRVKS